MSRPPRFLLPHTVALVTSRVQQGLPFVCTPLMEMILWSALAVAQNLYPIKIIAFVIMGNHIHLIVLVEDPEMIESFMERFKCETAHAVNRLLGRRQVTVWCEGYDSPAILTVDDLVEKMAYVYANPVRANRSDSIRTYHGISSWNMFDSGQTTKEIRRIRRPLIRPLPKGQLSPRQQKQLATVAQEKAEEALEFILTPNSWKIAFPNYASVEHFNQRVKLRLLQIEAEMAAERQAKRVTLPSAIAVLTQPINIHYFPQKFGRRMWCICSDVALRIAFIKFMKELRKKSRQVRLLWKCGNRSEPFPIGLFPPCQPVLANLLPAFIRKSITVV
jgi:REP element-mobilizing transposase RayT